MLDKRLRKSGYKFHSFGDVAVCSNRAGRLLVALSGSTSSLPSFDLCPFTAQEVAASPYYLSGSSGLCNTLLEAVRNGSKERETRNSLEKTLSSLALTLLFSSRQRSGAQGGAWGTAETTTSSLGMLCMMTAVGLVPPECCCDLVLDVDSPRNGLSWSGSGPYDFKLLYKGLYDVFISIGQNSHGFLTLTEFFLQISLNSSTRNSQDCLVSERFGSFILDRLRRFRIKPYFHTVSSFLKLALRNMTGEEGVHPFHQEFDLCLAKYAYSSRKEVAVDIELVYLLLINRFRSATWSHFRRSLFLWIGIALERGTAAEFKQRFAIVEELDHVKMAFLDMALRAYNRSGVVDSVLLTTLTNPKEPSSFYDSFETDFPTPRSPRLFLKKFDIIPSSPGKRFGVDLAKLQSKFLQIEEDMLQCEEAASTKVSENFSMIELECYATHGTEKGPDPSTLPYHEGIAILLHYYLQSWMTNLDQASGERLLTILVPHLVRHSGIHLLKHIRLNGLSQNERDVPHALLQLLQFENSEPSTNCLISSAFNIIRWFHVVVARKCKWLQHNVMKQAAKSVTIYTEDLVYLRLKFPINKGNSPHALLDIVSSMIEKVSSDTAKLRLLLPTLFDYVRASLASINEPRRELMCELANLYRSLFSMSVLLRSSLSEGTEFETILCTIQELVSTVASVPKLDKILALSVLGDLLSETPFDEDAGFWSQYIVRDCTVNLMGCGNLAELLSWAKSMRNAPSRASRFLVRSIMSKVVQILDNHNIGAQFREVQMS